MAPHGVAADSVRALDDARRGAETDGMRAALRAAGPRAPRALAPRGAGGAGLATWGRKATFRGGGGGGDDDHDDREAEAAKAWAAASCGVVKGQRDLVRNPDLAALSGGADNGRIDLDDAESVLMLDHDGMEKSTFAEIIASAQADIGTGAAADGRSGPELFMIDGGLGPHAGAHVRAITDHPGVAAILTLMLRDIRGGHGHAEPQNSGASSPEPGSGAGAIAAPSMDLSGRPDVVLVHSANPDAEAPDAYCATFGKRVVGRGVLGFRPLADALSQAVGKIISESKRAPSLCLSGDLVAHDTDPETCDLLVGVENIFGENATVLASHHVAWASGRVAPLWHCISEAEAPEAGAYVAQNTGDFVVPVTIAPRENVDRLILSPNVSADLTPTEVLVELGAFARRGSSQERVLLQSLLHFSGASVFRGFP